MARSIAGLRSAVRRGLVMLTLCLFFGAARAEVTKMDDVAEFSEAIHLSFEELPAVESDRILHGGAPLDTVVLEGGEYGLLGVSFLSEGSSRPVALSEVRVMVLGPSDWDVGIRNLSGEGAPPGEGFVLRFERPLRRVGLTLGNGGHETPVAIRAYGVSGEYLGSVERTGAYIPFPTSGPPLPLPFLGLSSTVPVASVVLVYGGDSQDEQVHDLYLEYFTPHVFVSYAPQVADGDFGSASVRTVLQIQNPFESPTAVRVDFLREGAPLALEIGDEMQSELNLDLAGFSCRQFETGGGAPGGGVGFARIESTLPIKAQALFRVTPGGGAPFQESGFQSTPARLHQIIPVELNREAGVDTAMAVANGSDKTARVFVTLRTPDGAYPTYKPLYDSSATVTINPRSNVSVFLSEVVPYLKEGAQTPAFRGSLEIRCLTPVAVAAVRTINGVAVSSVPAVGTD